MEGVLDDTDNYILAMSGSATLLSLPFFAFHSCFHSALVAIASTLSYASISL
ncbi:hypothetical protein EJ06DRAFT_529243 [Trichodelitschia bisporula]|uniref:Uncharacterized protein n=1 Tax=Trichodelitschia bisporula TaxID=703511 RepID=A0A6G1HZA7_9PEZI|nr:hypothetical protein EJ06DRAFT_529243 [Trichodelitschia bisporula]